MNKINEYREDFQAPLSSEHSAQIIEYILDRLSDLEHRNEELRIRMDKLESMDK